MGSIQAFLTHLIDYAGLFPPASLPLETSVRHYASYQADPDAWILGHFVIPATALMNLAHYKTLFSKEQPLKIAALGRKSADEESCREYLQEDLNQVASFHAEFAESGKVGVWEQPLPPTGVGGSLLAFIAEEAKKRDLRVFCELAEPFHQKREARLIEALDAIAAINAQGDTKLGLKLRTGGVTADAFPTVEQVAAVLIGCRDRGIALKFTAGLHHPIRMYRQEVQTRMHGFLNVFTAGLLACAHQLDAQTVQEILGDERAEHFSFQSDELTWRGLSISAAGIRRFREVALCSYGSCSFDEPRDDLRELHFYSQEEK